MDDNGASQYSVVRAIVENTRYGTKQITDFWAGFEKAALLGGDFVAGPIFAIRTCYACLPNKA